MITDDQPQANPGVAVFLLLPLVAPIVVGVLTLGLGGGHLLRNMAVAYVLGLAMSPLVAARANARARATVPGPESQHPSPRRSVSARN